METTVKTVITDYTREPLQSLRVTADASDISPVDRKKRVKQLAGAISHSLRVSGAIDVRALGKPAICKAVKALAITRKYIRDTDPNLRLSFSPAFITDDIEGGSLTGLKFCAFANEHEGEDVDLDKVEKVLIVKGDIRDIDPEDRKKSVRNLAGAISHAVEEKGECVIRCFGKECIAKGAKALAIARGFVATRGPDLYCWCDFIVAEIGDNEMTGIAFYCYANE